MFFFASQQRIDKPTGHNFLLEATARDSGNPPKQTKIQIHLEVTESDNKLPSFVDGPGEITLSEGYNELSKPVASYEARSNIPGDDRVFFTLVIGRTEKTNKGGTFRHVDNPLNPRKVDIYLAKPMDYEKVSEYMLALQVQNTPGLAP